MWGRGWGWPVAAGIGIGAVGYHGYRITAMPTTMLGENLLPALLLLLVI